MKTASRLAAAASLAALTALAPGLAAADDRGERLERDRRGPAWTDERGHRDDGWRADRWRHDDGRRGWEWRHDLQHQRVRAIRLELRRLDDDRAAFHARFGWRNHKKLARYDAWYAARRASLERELERLTWYAWR